MHKDTRYAARRTAIVAGLFYPDSREALDSAIRELLSAAPETSGIPAAIVSPHGAFSHSGKIQAAAWKAARCADPSRVVIIAPSHSGADKGIFLPESGIFETPLGDVAVDVASAAALADSCTDFNFYDIPHLEEHSIEIQLPFMQVLFPRALLVPVILARPERGTLAGLSRALDTVFGESPDSSLFVISSNMTADRDPASARGRSAEFALAAASGDNESLVRASVGKEAPCGAPGLAALASSKMMAGWRRELIMEDDTERLRESPEEPVVAYSAMAFYRK